MNRNTRIMKGFDEQCKLLKQAAHKNAQALLLIKLASQNASAERVNTSTSVGVVKHG